LVDLGCDFLKSILRGISISIPRKHTLLLQRRRL